MITLDNIEKEYNKKVVLRDVNMVIERGQSIAFTGHNGCGKSTLLKIIAGLVQPTKGNVNYERSIQFHYVPEHFPQM
ncbi:MAG: ATP-binding cassette domain-containing protein, partial [Lachnospiraceae bacterium]|nr:ATP-binding cassette domain-containing protein [Lachnospiraceae bacterium]